MRDFESSLVPDILVNHGVIATPSQWHVMIGLKRKTVRIADHDPEWARIGLEICASVRKICAGFDVVIEHAGSTSVPGLAAKPIIDVVMGLHDAADVSALSRRLTDAGYIYRGEGEGSVGHLFVWEPEPDVRSIHVHLVPFASSYWDDYVRFRDILRNDEDLCRRYEALKRKYAAKFPNDRSSYTASKHDMVRKILGNENG